MCNISHCVRHSSYTVSVNKKTVRSRQKIRNNFAVTFLYFVDRASK